MEKVENKVVMTSLPEPKADNSAPACFDLSRLDRVEPAGRAKVFMFGKVVRLRG